MTRTKPSKTSSIVVPANYIPTDEEAFMNDRMKEFFRRRLLEWREDIASQTRDTVEYLQGERVNHPDPTDIATRDRLRKLVRKIDKALARIEDGTYGYCEETGDPIGVGRLMARPIATLSLEAQELHERGERLRAG